MKIPDRWIPYSSIGKQIEGTRIICFKVPLKESFFEHRADGQNIIFTPQMLIASTPNLGLVIDLTATNRYYSPKEFTKRGIEYKKIFVQGHVIPQMANITKFNKTINAFLKKSMNRNSVIGIHCTHGVNRTGFLVCAYMISQLNFEPNMAIAKFNEARGHCLERSNYIAELKKHSVDFKIYDNNRCDIYRQNNVARPIISNPIRIRNRWGYETINTNSNPPVYPQVNEGISGPYEFRMDRNSYKPENSRQLNQSSYSWRNNDLVPNNQDTFKNFRSTREIFPENFKFSINEHKKQSFTVPSSSTNIKTYRIPKKS